MLRVVHGAFSFSLAPRGASSVVRRRRGPQSCSPQSTLTRACRPLASRRAQGTGARRVRAAPRPVESRGHVTPRPEAARARRDAPRADPQLLHHRAHRPRQVHAGRPDAADHRRRLRPRHARPVPRPHGHRARARHHDQVPGRADAVGARRQTARTGVRPEHDRHARSRRLHLRGEPLARRVRGRDPARGCRAGHRGADPRQPLPRARERPAHHPGAQQDRPAGRRSREVREGARQPHRRQARGRAARQRQDRHGRRGAARPRRPPDPGAEGRPGRARPAR